MDLFLLTFSWFLIIVLQNCHFFIFVLKVEKIGGTFAHPVERIIECSIGRVAFSYFKHFLSLFHLGFLVFFRKEVLRKIIFPK